MKINKESLTTSATTVVGCLGGAMASRVISDKLPFLKEDDKKKIKHGALAGVSLLAMVFAPTKGTAGTLIQSALAGSAVIQLNELIKDFINPQDGLLKTALGNTSYDDYTYNYTYDSIEPTYSDPMALSGIEEEEYFPPF